MLIDDLTLHFTLGAMDSYTRIIIIIKSYVIKVFFLFIPRKVVVAIITEPRVIINDVKNVQCKKLQFLR